MEQKEILTAIKLQNTQLVFSTPNSICNWRVKTLLSKEPCTIEWLDTLTPRDVLWDVGANIGLYSLYAAVLRQCAVVAFEPESGNYALLNRNIFHNKINTHVTAYCIGLNDNTEMGHLHLSKSEAGNSGHSISETNRPKLSQGSLNMTGNDLISLGAIPPTHIKIDVDGFDHKVVYGCSEILPSVRSVLIELNTRSQEQMRVVEFLQQRGFEYDPKQVERTARGKGDSFEHFREYIFNR